MNYLSIIIYTTHEGVEPVTGRLYNLGINGVEIKDKADIDEFVAENSENWDCTENDIISDMPDEVIIKAYVPDSPAGAETIKLIKASMRQLKDYDTEHLFGRLETEISETSDQDWANNWKKYYKPVHIGRHLVIVPKWEEYKPFVSDKVIKMDPGAAFGTGTHETTRLCLEFIEEFVSSNTNMLDIGTGSGILALTALKLGAKSAIGVDIDELAVKAAYENAQLNEVEDRFTAQCGSLAQNVSGTFNLITANIVADVIISLVPDIPAHLAPGGIFVTSGIIAPREEEVRTALLLHGMYVFDSKKQKDWVALACKRK
jgi:ribosomal protein L11 methyltransferase